MQNKSTTIGEEDSYYNREDTKPYKYFCLFVHGDANLTLLVYNLYSICQHS